MERSCFPATAATNCSQDMTNMRWKERNETTTPCRPRFAKSWEVWENAATIPPELKMRGNTRKYIFKRAVRGMLPDEIIDRPKRGFAIPLGRWFRGGLGNFVRDFLLSHTARQRNIIRPAYIEHLLDL